MFHFGDPEPIHPHNAAKPYDLRTSRRRREASQQASQPVGPRIAVDTIIDTAAANSYISRRIAEECRAEIFPLKVPHEVVGAGQTITVAFAKFMLCIRNVKEITMAYLLEEDSGFRYDLLLGRNWTKHFNCIPNWKDNSFQITSPKTHLSVRIQASHVPVRPPSYLSNDSLRPVKQDAFLFTKAEAEALVGMFGDDDSDADSIPDLVSVTHSDSGTDEPAEFNDESWDNIETPWDTIPTPPPSPTPSIQQSAAPVQEPNREGLKTFKMVHLWLCAEEQDDQHLSEPFPQESRLPTFASLGTPC
ncbi:hypothetical protein B0H14DRAFT_2596550 [Mycena olivaceomarginata]|nr:hypothetical protein B0H14DRAFT_2596550 [Mycena olivaceomarginata]